MIALNLALLAVACQQSPDKQPGAPEAGATPSATPAPATLEALPADRIGEDVTPTGATEVLERYFGLIGTGRATDAWALWSDGGAASGLDAAVFAESFAGYSDYRGDVGTPGTPEGAAGSVYVEVPVRVSGRTGAGSDFSARGIATLRRVNEVPGSTAEQRRWRIYNLSVDTPR